MILDWPSVILIAFVVMVTGISKSAFAGALGVFSVPLLMLKFSAIEAITLMLPILIIADIMSVKSFWKKWDPLLLRMLIPGALFGLALGHLTINIINADHLRTVIAVICIIFSLRNMLFKHIKLKAVNNKTAAYIMSAFSGVTSTLVHAGGPPLIIYLSAIKLTPTTFVATAAVFFAAMNFIKLIGFISLGFFTSDILLTAIAFAPLAFIGNKLGLKINEILDKQRFLKIMNYLLFGLGLWLSIT